MVIKVREKSLPPAMAERGGTTEIKERERVKGVQSRPQGALGFTR